MEKKQYAPIVIPTLNRYSHFKECLESLEDCTGAEHTDIYIALDYPPSEKYVAGWEKIDEYLHFKELNHKFKSITVYRRKTNFFFTKSGNHRPAMDDVFKHEDRIIFSEDDNVFSKNFLEYINEGLEAYKVDKNCTAICGYNYENVKLNGYHLNAYLSHEYSSWGVGLWKDKWYEMCKHNDYNYAKSIMKDWSAIWKIYRNEPRLLNTIILNLDCGVIFGDTMYVAYQYINGTYSLFPTLSKVRNMGFDGSGTSIFETNESNKYQPIDSNRTFKLDKIGYSSLRECEKKVIANFKRNSFMNIIILFRCFIYHLFGFDILYFEAKRRNRSLFKRHLSK